MLNEDSRITNAQDYDAWGYILENRSYGSENSKYKFTGKERDKDIENNYDYFGARYYDSRIANWTSTDPLFDRVIGVSPYAYVSRNPLRYFDNNGNIQLPAELVQKYPKLASILQNDLPKAIENKKTMKALQKWTTLSAEQIKEDFQGDKGPILNVVQMSDWGSFEADKDPNKINIQESTVNYFEKSSGDVQDVLSFFIQVVIMHEYTHYGANKAGVGFYYKDGDKNYMPDEEGWRFEEAAYGQQMGGPDVAAQYMNKQNERAGVAKTYPTNVEEDLRKNR
jgi:RHS repeat-associated protein